MQGFFTHSVDSYTWQVAPQVTHESFGSIIEALTGPKASGAWNCLSQDILCLDNDGSQET